MLCGVLLIELKACKGLIICSVDYSVVERDHWLMTGLGLLNI